ncbi:hypothetical protein, partial [Mesorhizobium sp.]
PFSARRIWRKKWMVSTSSGPAFGDGRKVPAKVIFSEQTVWQACATFGRFQPFGKTLAEIAAYISATIDKGFASARP